MKILSSNQVTNTMRLLSALQAAGLNVITIRGHGGRLVQGTHLADSVEVVLDDSADLKLAQQIIDAFDPVSAQAEIEAEEVAESERQAFLKLAKDKWLNEFIPLRNWARTKGYPG